MILFAKAPVSGRVKTRLIPFLGPASAAELHSAFVRDSYELLVELRLAADIELYTDTPTGAWSDIPARRSLQGEGTLGDRIQRALGRALDCGYRQALVLGADSPGLPSSYVERLLEAGAELALGPAEDGGFYGIKCRRIVEGMFAGVHWSAPTTLEDTVRAAQRCGLTVDLGSPWFDVDRPDDLIRLLAVPGLRRHTRDWLGQNGSRLTVDDIGMGSG